MICCFAIYGGTMGVGWNCIGIFNAAIAKDLGLSISAFTFSSIFNGLAAAVMLLFTDRIFKNCNIKTVLFISTVCYALHIGLRAVCSEIWQFCLINVLGGAACAFLFYVPVPMLINAWFREKNGIALSVATLSSGVIGAILNPVLGNLIASNGWRFASVVNGIVSAAIALPFILFLLVKTPEEAGLRPYGWKPEPERKPVTSPSEVDITEHMNIDYTPSEKRVRLFLSIILAFMVYLVSTCVQQMAHYAQVNGLSVMAGSALASAGMIGNLSGKAGIGAVIEKLGKRKTFAISFSLAAAGDLILAFLPGAPIGVLYAGIALAAISAANNAIAMPIVVAGFSAGEEYVTFISKVSVATMISTAFGSYISSALYDLTGSYVFEYVLYAALTMIGLAIVLYVLKEKKK